MQTVKLYLYPNLVELQVVDPSIFTVRNRIVYSREITVYQGIDNRIQIVTKNQDQKYVDMSGYSIQADIQDPTNQVTVVSLAVTYTDVSKGVAYFVIPRDIVNTLEQRFYKLTFKAIQVDTNIERPIYIDDNYGVPLDLKVLPAYESRVATQPTIERIIIDGGIIGEVGE